MKIITYGVLAVGLSILILYLSGVPIVSVEKTVITQSSKGESTKLSLRGFSQLKAKEVTVYHRRDQKKLAQDISHALQTSLNLVENRLGISGTLSVALFQYEEFDDVSSRSFSISGNTWPLFVSKEWSALTDANETFQLKLYWTMPHEATESVISRMLYLDRRARWIGDGLAEYAGYIATKELSESSVSLTDRRLRDLKQRVTSLIESGHTTYNLTKDFQVITESGSQQSNVERTGYSVSFAFWYEVAQQHGEETIRTFWKRFKSLNRVCVFRFCWGADAEDAARILSELTGEDTWVKVQSVNLQHTLEILKSVQAENALRSAQGSTRSDLGLGFHITSPQAQSADPRQLQAARPLHNTQKPWFSSSDQRHESRKN